MALLKKLFIKQAENKRFGVVDKNGNWFLEPKYRKAWRSGRYIIIGQKGKWAIIDALNGEWLDDVEDYYYDNVEDSFEYGALKLIEKRKDREEIEYLFDNGDCYDKNTADIFIENEEELEMISDEEDIMEGYKNISVASPI